MLWFDCLGKTALLGGMPPFLPANEMPLHAPGATRLAWRPCGDSNAGICLRRAALYPLSYRGFLDRILTQPKWGDKTRGVVSIQGAFFPVMPKSVRGWEWRTRCHDVLRPAQPPAGVYPGELCAPCPGFRIGVAH